MATPEQKGVRNSEQPPPSYCQAARFNGEEAAGLAYFQAHDMIFETDCDLSVYRFQFNRVWHVAILGEPPPEFLTERLDILLPTGESASLPYNVLELLLQRRRQATEIGPWVERHQR